ncbi:hypothetical protein [Rhodovarius lipocyclicus]|uniref:hypothetical protein n=1 Tax=Rhodovarius lipocyclicus TaxID=268410 RepID=UPI00135A3325|nr:hypothetical protein [Rhodovarius lipocyclicus]
MLKAVKLGFIAGVLAFLVFHQGTVHLLHYLGDGLRPWIGHVPAPFPMGRVAPLGVPQFVSLAFWSGVWGIVLALLLRLTRLPDLLTGFLFGAAVITGSVFTWIATLKGLPHFAGGNQQIILRAVLLNGVLGWGTAVWLRPMSLRG